MASIVQTSVSGNAETEPLDTKEIPQTTTTSSTSPQTQRLGRSKYRHVAAYHSSPQASCLSREYGHAPSFVGFRNLMIIVLGMDIYLLLELIWGRFTLRVVSADRCFSFYEFTACRGELYEGRCSL